MGDDDGVTLSVDEFVEYCRTQAGLLAGSVETMADDASALLDDIDEEVAEIRDRLDALSGDVEGTASPPSTFGPDDTDVVSVEELESAIEEKQALVEAKHARMRAFQKLAAGYTGLAEELQSDVDGGREAMEHVVRFEAEHDAPAYFEDRMTVYEVVVQSRDTDGE